VRPGAVDRIEQLQMRSGVARRIGDAHARHAHRNARKAVRAHVEKFLLGLRHPASVPCRCANPNGRLRRAAARDFRCEIL
jgi:hypothetical protein